MTTFFLKRTVGTKTCSGVHNSDTTILHSYLLWYIFEVNDSISIIISEILNKKMYMNFCAYVRVCVCACLNVHRFHVGLLLSTQDQKKGPHPKPLKTIIKNLILTCQVNV